MRSENEINTEIEVTKLVGVLAASFPQTQMSAKSVNAYVAMLKDIPLDVLTVAVEQCVVESEFLPTIAKVRNKALSLVRPERKDPMEAWGVVLKTIKRVGFYRSPTFDDPLIAQAVDCLGWQYLCTSENIVADRAHFAKVYEQFREREIQDSRLLPQAIALRAMNGGRIQEIGDGRGF